MQNTGNLVDGRREGGFLAWCIPRRGRERKREGRESPSCIYSGGNTFSLVGKQKLSSKATVLHFHLVSRSPTLCISEFAISFRSYSAG